MKYAILHNPPGFSAHSGMQPLAAVLNAKVITYGRYWENVAHYSWTAGNLLQRWGIQYYGSIYNWLFPVWDEYRFLKYINFNTHPVIHFIWSDFASPSVKSWFNRSKCVTIGTYHSSKNRLSQVCKKKSRLHIYDRITLMSKSQVPFFINAGYPEENLRVILHGVETQYFVPAQHPPNNKVMTAFMIGSTERDHKFLADVLRKLPSGVLTVNVRTHLEQQVHYEGIPCVSILRELSLLDLLGQYQKADIVIMPMIDCTANNAFMEAMACGTPIMTNRIGGVEEYVNEDCNFVMQDKDVDEWVNRIIYLSNNRAELFSKRTAVRNWAEQFDWTSIALQYEHLYSEVYAEKGLPVPPESIP